MRRLLKGMLLVSLLGLLGSLAVVSVGPVLDEHWQTVGVTQATSPAGSIAGLLARAENAVGLVTRAENAPLLFVPDSVTAEPVAPVTLVLVLPGLGGTGRVLAEDVLAACAVPGFDPTEKETLTEADVRVDQSLLSLADQVVARSPFHVAPVIDVVGFSRGAQTAHRFALRHPERVAGLASFSAGTYTMPTSSQPYPLGMGYFDLYNHQRPLDIAALRKVSVLVGVGAADANPADVVRDWDAVGGTTRLERGTRFAEALQQLKVPSRFQVYPGVGHTFTPAMATVNVRYMVDDVDAAVAFYTTHLGFKLLSSAAPAFADVARGDLRLLLSGATSSAGRPMPDGRRPTPGGWSRIQLVVDDIAAEVERLRAAGVRFRNDIVRGPGGSQILLEDPSGNPIELFKPAAR